MNNEHVILVDDADREIGTAQKLEAHRAGSLHRAFSVVIWDHCGRMLLQQRAADKYHSGGLWSNTCCGHPRPGENIAQAAARRLKEEMGVACDLAPLGTIRYQATFDNGLSEHEIVHVFRGRYEGPVDADPKEAADFAWKSLDDVRADVAARPEAYSVWFRAYVDAAWPTTMMPPE